MFRACDWRVHYSICDAYWACACVILSYVYLSLSPSLCFVLYPSIFGMAMRVHDDADDDIVLVTLTIHMLPSGPREAPTSE